MTTPHHRPFRGLRQMTPRAGTGDVAHRSARAALLRTLPGVFAYRRPLDQLVRNARPRQRLRIVGDLLVRGHVREAIAGSLRAGDDAALSALAARMASAADPLAYAVTEALPAAKARPHVRRILERELAMRVPLAGVLAYVHDAGVELSPDTLADVAAQYLDAGDVESALLGFGAAGRVVSAEKLVTTGEMMRAYGNYAAARLAFAAAGVREQLLALGRDCVNANNIGEAMRCFAVASAAGELRTLAATLRAAGDLDGAADAEEMASDLS
jgi:hypothetical protein